MAKKKSKGKFKPYQSPNHAHDQPVHNMPDPSGGLHQGLEIPGAPEAPAGTIGQPGVY